MSSIIGLIGSGKKQKKGKVEVCVSKGKKKCWSLARVLLLKRESETLAGQLACLIMLSPGAEQSPSPLLIKASLSRVSGSFLLSADFFPHSAARAASGFHPQRW